MATTGFAPCFARPPAMETACSSAMPTSNSRWNTGKDSLYDMQLMSRCKHNICANSTFSLWGARLNKNTDKLVIRPLRHDNYEKTDEKTVHENWKGWILVDSDGSVKNPYMEE